MANQTRVKLFFDMEHHAQILAPYSRDGWELVAFVCDDTAGWIAYLERR